MASLFYRKTVRFFSGNSLSRSLMLGITATVCCMLFVMSLFYYSQLYIDTLEKAEHLSATRMANLSKILSMPIWNVDYDTVERIISVSSELDTILRIRVEEPDGKLISSIISDTRTSADKIISQNVDFNGERIGRIVAHITFAPIKEAQRYQFIYHTAFMGLLLLLILAFTKKILTVYLRNPLDHLDRMIAQLGKGEYPANTLPPHTKELREIANSFEAMAEKVAAREHDLTQINYKLHANIEERKRVERKLRTSQEQFTLVAASTMDGITDIYIGEDMMSYTPRWKQLLGYTDDELTNSLSVWLEKIHPNDREWAKRLTMAEDYDPTGRAEGEYRILHKDGRYRWFYGRAQIIFDDQGIPIRLIGTHTDITPRKLAEQKIIASREILQNVINCMPSLIVGVTKQMSITLWNETAEETTGVVAKNAEGKEFKQLFPELSFIERHIKRSLREEKTVTVSKVTSIRKNIPITYDIIIFPVTHGSQCTAVLRIDDVTDKLRMEEMIIQTEKMASISGLAAGMAHEINNPLGGILQGVQNVQRRFSTSLAPNVKTADELGFSLEQVDEYMHEREIHNLLGGITECGKRAASIIANMLEFSRSANTKRVPVDVHSVIEKSIDLMQNDYQLRQQTGFTDIIIVREYSKVNTKIFCSPQEIEQVLLNLLKNAAQALLNTDPAIEAPTIAITTEQTPTGVAMTVSDNGPGMEEDVRKRVFEPFYTTKPVGEGTGLGLSVSYFIITNNHSGSISVTSTKDQGASFNIHLPFAM